MIRKLYSLTLVVAAMIALSCGGGSSSLVSINPAAPGLTGERTADLIPMGSKALWGVWEVIIDTQTMETRVVPQRGVEYTVDAVAFLQYPKGKPTNLQINITDLTKWHSDGIMGVEVGLMHPFPGLDQYAGFDVMGVLIGSGSLVSSYDSNVVYSDGVNDATLLNPDGYTRWMNPAEFTPDGTILRFVPGNLGSQDLPPLNSTVNGYKYFADGLGPDQDLYSFFQTPANVDMRGQFSPGYVNSRDYSIKFPMSGGTPQLVFQYAVIANWVQPDKTMSGDPDVIDIPGDYPPSANAPESFLCHVTDNSTLWFNDGQSGGDLSLSLEVFDWAGYISPGSIPSEISAITLESQNSLVPGGAVSFSGLSLTAYPGTTAASSVFMVDIPNCAPTSVAGQEVLITIEQTNGAFAPNPDLPPVVDSPLASYARFAPYVADEPPTPDFVVIDPNGGETLWMALYHEIKWQPGSSSVADVKIEWSTDDFVSDIRTIVDSTENDGSYTWKPIPNVATQTAKVRISEISGAATDTSDDYFTIDKPVWLEFQQEVPVNPETITWNYYEYSVDYSQAFDEFSPALSQDRDGLAHICWSSEIALPNDPTWPRREAREVGIRSMDGDAWDGEGGFFFTWGSLPDPKPQYECRGDYLKLAPAANNTTFAAVWHWTIYFSVDVDHFPNNHLEYNAYVLTNRIYKNSEIMADDQNLYLVSDGWVDFNDGPGIYYQRVPTPDPTWPTSTQPMQTISNFGEISHSRSWVSQNAKLMLIFFTTDGQVRLAKQIDPAADTWDDSEIVFESPDFTGCTDPTIALDGDGRLFAAWVAQEAATGQYVIMASMKETPDGTWTPPVIAATSADQFDELHVTTSSEKVLLPTADSEYMVLIGYELNHVVHSQISPMDLWAFLPEQPVTNGDDICHDPDTMCMRAPYTYDALFTWNYEVVPGTVGWGDHDIRFRNADFKTP